MSVVGVTMVRDEEDIVGTTVRNMLDQVDAVIVADNLSTDSTPEILAEILAEHPRRLRVVEDRDPAYTQSEKMTRLAGIAGIELGAEWIVPFDADEIWRSPHGRVADVLTKNVPDGYHVAPARLFDHYATDQDDPAELDPVRRMKWRRTFPGALPKVAARWRPDLVIEQGNHGAHYDIVPAHFETLIEIRHFPYRSAEQLVRKVRNGAGAYRAAGDRVRSDHGAHWREWGDLLDERGPEAIAAIFEVHYRRTGTLVLADDPMTYDPVEL